MKRSENIDVEASSSVGIERLPGGTKRVFDPLTPRNFCVIVSVTFLMALSYLVDFQDENNPVARTISDVSLLVSKPGSWKYENDSSKHNGVMIMGAPMSRLSLLTSYLDEAGFRLSKKDEDIDEVVFTFDALQSDVDFGEGIEPLQRVDSFHENDILLNSQNFKWNSHDIASFDANKAKPLVMKELAENSDVLELVKGHEDDIEPWAWQDPQLCITLPAWVDSIHGTKKGIEDFKLATVFTYRHPFEMAQMLQKKYPFMSLTRGLKMWLNYNQICLKNLKKQENMCVVYTSNKKLSADPQYEINKVLTELDQSCDIAPGLPGRLGKWGAYYNRKYMREYEAREEVILEESNPYQIDDLRNDIVAGALGINELMDERMTCEYYHIDREENGDIPENDWVYEDFNAVMEELDDMDAYSKQDLENIQMEKDKLQKELENEIYKWMGEEAADGMHQIFHLHETSKATPGSPDSPWLQGEKVNNLKTLRKEIRFIFENAMQVFCDMEKGDVFDSPYEWPELTPP